MPSRFSSHISRSRTEVEVSSVISTTAPPSSPGSRLDSRKTLPARLRQAIPKGPPASSSGE